MKKTIISCLCGLFGVNATISHNKAQNGIEVKFTSKPSDQDISFLKANRFRWSSRKHLWYVTYSDALFKKVQERLSELTQTSDTATKPISVPVPEVKKELTIEEKAIKQLDRFNSELANNWKLEFIYKLAKAGIKSFLDNPPAIVYMPDFGDIPYEYDAKRQQYWILPRKRKRPDWYSQGDVFNDLLNKIASKGGNAGLWNHVKFKIMRRDLYSKHNFEYWIKIFPQYTIDPDYPAIKSFYDDLDRWSEDEEKRWQEWFNQNINVGASVYTKKDNQWIERTIVKKGYQYMDRSYSTIETQRNHGFIIESATYDISNIYDRPDGKPFTEIYPDARPNVYGAKPRITEYVEGVKVAETSKNITANKENIITSVVKKYGWTATNTNEIWQLHNRKGKFVATITDKNGNYIISHADGTKLLTGNADLSKAIEKVIVEYFYGSLISETDNNNQVKKRNLDYFIELLKNSGIEFKKLSDKVWQDAIKILSKVDDKELIFNGSSKQKREKIVQMAAYKVLSNEPAYELSRDAYDLKKFIGSAFTEAMIMDDALYIPSEKNAHLKELQYAISQGKVIPDYVLTQFPELIEKNNKNEISDEYAIFLLNKIEETFTKQFPDEKFDKTAIAKNWLENAEERSINRANAILEEIYLSYISKENRAYVYQNIAKEFQEYKKKQKPKSNLNVLKMKMKAKALLLVLELETQTSNN